MTKLHPVWSEALVGNVADVLGHTESGLTGSQIGRLLAEVGVADIASTATKRDRLRLALVSRQAKDGAANCVIAFITRSMTPMDYAERPDVFALRRAGLNEVLVFQGLKVTEGGRVARGPSATTLSEAARHANTLRTELRRRGTHPLVLAACTDELLAKNSFHGSFEAIKSVADRLRMLSGLSGDGARLVDATLSLGTSGKPTLAINSLQSDSDRDEQVGFATLLKGLFSMYRNPLAHDPRSQRTVTDEELLELLALLSMVHRRLDVAPSLPLNPQRRR